MERTAEDLVAAYRILAEHGVIDAYGHVSLRSPRQPAALLPRARHRAGAGAAEDDLIEYDLDSRPIDDSGPRVGARALHPRRDLQGAARRDGGGAQPLALGGARSASPACRCAPSSTWRRSSATACRTSRSAT